MKSNVLVDTSVWIQYFNRIDSKPGQAVEGLLRQERAVGTGIVLTELLQGAKVEKEFDAILESLAALPFLETTQSTWVTAGKISYILRRKGIAIPTTDLLIASIALEYDCLIFSLDPHFEKIPDIEPYKYI
jgi:tRNA(fMet)-specific endonuclease VapC